MSDNDVFDHRLEILKKELDSLDDSIKGISENCYRIKNWSIITWMGSVAVILREPSLHSYILLTAGLPVAFLVSEALWRRLWALFAHRRGQIGEFINSDGFVKAVETREFTFQLLQGTGQLGKSKLVTFLKMLRLPTVWVFYSFLSLLSIVLAIFIHFNQPVAEQVGADQPATAPESRLENNQNPQPESERRSQ